VKQLDRTAGGEIANTAVDCLEGGGRKAYSYGIHPSLRITRKVKLTKYHGKLDREIINRLHHYISVNKLTPPISHTFSLKDAQEAHAVLNHHYLGKICLQIP
jgi:NADPH:quinone reductase-like Zn-dependent oxidoreductase